MVTLQMSKPAAQGWERPARIVVGLIWLGGAVWNLAVTTRMSEPYAWLEETPVAPYRWFFREVVSANPVAWTVALAVGEIALGTLTLSRGSRARLGLAGGSLFSAFLVSLATPYTLMMAPYALMLAWLSRFDYQTSSFGRLTSLVRGRRSRASAASGAADVN